MTTRLTAEKAAHAISRRTLRAHAPIADIPHRLYCVLAELVTQPADAHVHDVAPGTEREPPHVGEELLSETYVGRAVHQMHEQEEFLLGEVHRPGPGIRSAAAAIESDPADPPH